MVFTKFEVNGSYSKANHLLILFFLCSACTQTNFVLTVTIFVFALCDTQKISLIKSLQHVVHPVRFSMNYKQVRDINLTSKPLPMWAMPVTSRACLIFLERKLAKPISTAKPQE